MKCVSTTDISKDYDQIPINDSHPFSAEEIDSIIGRTYSTRSIKRSYEEDSVSVEPNQNIYRQKKTMKDKRDLLHLKDAYQLTDTAFNAIFPYIFVIKENFIH